jgi:elongation factor G
MAFKIAGSMAAKDGVSKADPAILSRSKVEVVAPESSWAMSSATSTASAAMDGVDERGTSRVISAHVPLVEMLRHRRAQHDPGSRHALDGVFPLPEVPANLAAELIAKSKS